MKTLLLALIAAVGIAFVALALWVLYEVEEMVREEREDYHDE